MSKIPTGTKVLGVAQSNKGAVGCTFLLGGCERMCFIACHLNARAERVTRRGQDFANIYTGISLDQQVRLPLVLVCRWLPTVIQ